MKRSDPIALAQCPCGRPATYSQCCARWHDGPLRLRAPDAELLMRSRYSAYVLDQIDYLLETWHPETRPSKLQANPPGLQWLGLEVRRHVQVDETHATVEFVARCKQGGRAQRIHETSRFERQHGFWIYIDGTTIGKP
jgi:SEC-C motif domain protein